MKKILIVFAVILLSAPLQGQDRKIFRIGVDTSVDGFLSSDNRIGAASFGVGARVRLGRYDQWLNLVGGLRYIYGASLSGFQVPILLNLNLIKGRQVSGYLGGGYEFDFIGTYWGCMKVQTGLAGKHFDFRIFYKPYQGDIGAGFTYYF